MCIRDSRKDLASVIAAHDIPYVAQTTFVQNFKDLHIKSEKAIYTPGAAFLNIMACLLYTSHAGVHIFRRYTCRNISRQAHN